MRGRVRPLRPGRLWAAVAVSALPFCYPLARADLAGGPVPAVAGVCGLLGGLALWWQVALGARQAARLFGADRGRILTAHAWLGSGGAFLVLLHPLLEATAELRGPDYLVAVDFTWVESTYTSLGRLALLMFLALWLTSTLLRAAARHRVWRYAHYLSYPLVALVFLHADGIGTFLGAVPWLRAYWLALAAAFGAVTLWRLLAPLLVPRYRLAAAERVSGAVTVYRLAPRGRRRVRPLPGQFCHLRTSVLSRSHPLSAVRSDPETAELVFAVRDAGSFTVRLRRLRPGATVLVDGPHGAFTREAQLGGEPAVLIAGGIGVTPFVDLALRRPDVTLFHAVASPADAVFAPELRRALGERYVPSRRDGVPPERFTGARLTRGAPARARYFVCGSPRFVAGIIRELRSRGVPRDRVLTERFEW
ncbi:ferric reductase-like transmembrane domain-containing protein [Bailinhaonella thermotolerans]|uniref:ferric reductase-like transmembrane domain-containing protein n=1 Tax=Bailinhaonella thermotolerans TaxID=1070861 RepID=UPI00192A6604|nr:ferredoxin reductase family protein [Bailinhaonella thermotolerans]